MLNPSLFGDCSGTCFGCRGFAPLFPADLGIASAALHRSLSWRRGAGVVIAVERRGERARLQLAGDCPLASPRSLESP